MNLARTLHVGPGAAADGDGSSRAPLSLEAALERAAAEPAPRILLLEEGVYRMPWPLRFGPELSHLEIKAAVRGKAVFDGGFDIEGWREETLEGPGKVWVADVSQRVAASGPFKFLSVNGEPRERCRYPESREAEGEKSESRLRCRLPEVLLQSAEFREWELVLYYDWVCRRLEVSGVDGDGIDFVPDGTQRGRETLFHIENAPLALLKPGQWKLETSSGRLFYRPGEGEALENLKVTAPVAPHLLDIRGDPGDIQGRRYVEGLAFDGVVFRHTGDGRLVNSNQADWRCSAAVTLSGALDCRFEHCLFTNTSGWGLALEEGSRRNLVSGCRFESLGAGGIKANGDPVPESPLATGNNRLVGNTILHGGRRWAGAVGILLRHTGGNEVSQNEVAHFPYSGISCGWTWGYKKSAARENLIADNHIHHLGQDHLLVDLGAIYTLGIQPGTVIRGNVIHDIAGKSISWGIYLDEGSSEIVVEQNLVYRVSSECLHLHYGRNNRVRDNVFAFGDNGTVSITRGTMDIQCRFTPGDKALILERNVFVSDAGPFYVKYILDYEIKEDFQCISSDRNVFQCPDPDLPAMAGDGYHCHHQTYQALFTAEEWRRLGFDAASRVGRFPSDAAPGIMSPGARTLYSRLVQATERGRSRARSKEPRP